MSARHKINPDHYWRRRSGENYPRTEGILPAPPPHRLSIRSEPGTVAPAHLAAAPVQLRRPQLWRPTSSREYPASAPPDLPLLRLASLLRSGPQTDVRAAQKSSSAGLPEILRPLVALLSEQVQSSIANAEVNLPTPAEQPSARIPKYLQYASSSQHLQDPLESDNQIILFYFASDDAVDQTAPSIIKHDTRVNSSVSQATGKTSFSTTGLPRKRFFINNIWHLSDVSAIV